MIVTVTVEDAGWLGRRGLEAMIERAVKAAAARMGAGGDCAVAVLLTGDEAMAELNGRWRGEHRPTNVLSFPSPARAVVPAGEQKPLGDIVLASGVVAREAQARGKALEAHAAHLVVHGTLHLFGLDHAHDGEARVMEQTEALILRSLGLPDPYEGERP